MNQILLDLLAYSAVLSGVLVISSNHPILGVLSLISVFICVSGYLALLGLTFISLTYLIIYVGAIAILFLFVILLLDIKLVELSSGSGHLEHFPLGFLFSIFLYLGSRDLTSRDSIWEVMRGFEGSSSRYFLDQIPVNWTQFAPFTHLESVGVAIYSQLPGLIILAGLILLLAILGPILLTFEIRETQLP